MLVLGPHGTARLICDLMSLTALLIFLSNVLLSWIVVYVDPLWLQRSTSRQDRGGVRDWIGLGLHGCVLLVIVVGVCYLWAWHIAVLGRDWCAPAHTASFSPTHLRARIPA